MLSLFFSLLAASASVLVAGQSQAVDGYLAKQSPISKAGLLANIGPTGSKSKGAKAGSPSQVDPDYLYTWTRDSGLVGKAIIDQLTSGHDTTLRPTIDNYILSQKRIQQISNPSGTVSTGGLGEAKYNIDETAFTGGWGRPQRDGPALRATAFITYGNWLIENGNTTFVTSTLWPAIKLDLDYVQNNWNSTGFDLWEEVNSASFFTTAVQHRALREGATFAAAIGQSSLSSGYTAQASNLLCFLQSYWNPSGGYITANTGGGRSGKDANTVLASIHTFDPTRGVGCDRNTFQPCSDRALSNLLVYVNSFRTSSYSINNGIAADKAVATGRYVEDVYYNGNPWYLTTLSVAEQLYRALYTWNLEGSLVVTDVSLAFFRTFFASITTGTYASTTTTYTLLTTAVRNYADGFVAKVAQYTPSNGALAEQYSKSNGSPLSAADLTWSYASLLTTEAARSGRIPSSWGARGLTVPATCSTAGPGNPGIPGSGQVAVTFNVQATTVFGENIYLVGSADALENWNVDDAIVLSSAAYPRWSVSVNLPANTVISYKFVRKFNGAVTWESDPNRSFTTPASGTITRTDTWK